MANNGRVGSIALVRAAGVTFRQLDYWARLGVLNPEVGADGPGTQRLWSIQQVRIAALLGRLAARGATVPLAVVLAEVTAAEGFAYAS